MSKGTILRILLMAGTAGLLLTIGAAGADAQTVIFRPALDSIGAAEAPAAEASGAPDADLGFDYDQGAHPARGRVIIESATALPANGHPAHRWRRTFPQ